nr:BSD domain-containing family protein [Ipomoea batatas]
MNSIASNILQLGSDEEEDDSWTKGAVARDIAMHPETWIDFPLPENEDFDMFDAQKDHTLAVEHLALRLAALRIELLCPSHMSGEPDTGTLVGGDGRSNEVESQRSDKREATSSVIYLRRCCCRGCDGCWATGSGVAVVSLEQCLGLPKKSG